MRLFHRNNPLLIICLLLAGTGVLYAPTGCQNLPRSGFDPSGERLFESNPLRHGNLSLAHCELLGRPKNTTPTTVAATPTNPPNNAIASDGASVYNPQAVAGLPGELGAVRTNPNVPQYSNTATAMPPNTHAVTTALVASPDSIPKQPFNDTGGYALPTVPVQGPALIMTPREQIAPIGSEVVLISSYLGNKDRLITNEKVEWTLEGVGTIEQFDPGSHCDPLFGDYLKAKKQTDRYAITKTSQVYRTLDRGTADTTDDIHLLRGQTWVTVNSMKEGTTHVTAFAPSLADWSKRTDVGIIHWVDAQWIIPRLSLAPVGESRVLTTTVLRASNGQPRNGWIVQYEILNGPSAGLGATNARIEQISTDISGQATVILTPTSQMPGTNTVRISIIRPAGVDGSDRQVTVGSELVRQTWSGNPNVVLNIQGPPTASPGIDLPYKITVNNRTSQYVSGQLLLPIPPLASYIRSNPAGQLAGSTLVWNCNVAPGSTTVYEVVVKQGTSGSLWMRPEFRRTGTYQQQTAAPQTNTVTVPAQSSATRFSGTAPQTNPPRTPPPAANTPATNPPQQPAQTYQPQPKASLKLLLQPDSDFPIKKGQPFVFNFFVENNGAKEVRNVRLEIPLPDEFRGRTLQAASYPELRPGTSERAVKLDIERNVVVLDDVSIPPQDSVHIKMEYPTIDENGWNVTGEVFVNGVSAGKKTERLGL